MIRPHLDRQICQRFGVFSFRSLDHILIAFHESDLTVHVALKGTLFLAVQAAYRLNVARYVQANV